ncbi:MAG: hypothetical protein KBB23_07745 [Smithella sp.]|nr:hypothetical protein [Smithella sp.]
MSNYQNFTVDFPKRVAQLDVAFRPFALGADLLVSYTLMRLASGFLIPYERVNGTSGAGRAEVSSKKRIRSTLELDRPFCRSGYCSDKDYWMVANVEDFDAGPVQWKNAMNIVGKNVMVCDVLRVLRNSTAHSNLFFGGEEQIEHIFLGNKLEQDRMTNKYQVFQCTPSSLDHLLNRWFLNMERLRDSPALIWAELEAAA